MEPAVVVPAHSAASSVTCLRSLSRRNIHTISVSEHARAPAFSSRYCDESIVVPSPREDVTEYSDALLSLARRDDVRTIIPIREEDIYVLAKNRAKFGEYVSTLWPTFDTLQKVHDRVRLLEIAREAGVSIPETELLDEVDDWKRKLIVKPRYSLLTTDYVDSVPPTEVYEGGPTQYLEPGVEPDRESVRSEMGHVPIVQEYVSGTEYAFWALYDHGEPVATCQRNRIRGFQYTGNASIYRETVREPQLESVGRALLDSLDWHGLASVQVIKDDTTGEFTLMEINPRFWLSLPTAVRAGVDFPYYYWQVATGDRPRIDTDYEVGVATHLLLGEASYLNSVLRKDDSYIERPGILTAIRDVVVSLFEQPQFDHLTLDDPGPFFRDLLNTVSELQQSDDRPSCRELADEGREQFELPLVE